MCFEYLCPVTSLDAGDPKVDEIKSLPSWSIHSSRELRQTSYYCVYQMTINTTRKVERGGASCNNWFQIKTKLTGKPLEVTAEQKCVWFGLYLGGLVLSWFPSNLTAITKPLSFAPLLLHHSPFRSWPEAQGVPRSPRKCVCQPPASDPACPTTDGYFRKLASFPITTGSWAGKQQWFSPSHILRSVVKSPAPIP